MVQFLPLACWVFAAGKQRCFLALVRVNLDGASAKRALWDAVIFVTDLHIYIFCTYIFIVMVRLNGESNGSVPSPSPLSLQLNAVGRCSELLPFVIRITGKWLCLIPECWCNQQMCGLTVSGSVPGMDRIVHSQQSIFLTVIAVLAASGLQQGKTLLAAWCFHLIHLCILPNKLLTENTPSCG